MAVVESALREVVVLVGVPLKKGSVWMQRAQNTTRGIKHHKGESNTTRGNQNTTSKAKKTYGISDGVSGLEGGSARGRLMSVGCDCC
jgi:hypothetical protein